MHLSWRTLIAGLLALAILALAQQSARTAESPLAGNWKLSEVGAADTALVLLKIGEKDGKAHAEALSSPALNETATVQSIKVEGGVIHLELKFVGGPLRVTLYPDKDDKAPKLYRGSIQFGQRVILAQLERTDADKLERKDLQTKGEAAKQLEKASGLGDPKEQEAALQEVVEKYGDTGAGYVAAQTLLVQKARSAEKADDVRPAAEGFVKVAARFGPAAEHSAVLAAVRSLAGGEKTAPLALEYARKAEETFLKDEVSPRKMQLLKSLAATLRKVGKEDEAKQVDARIAKLDKDLDEDFLKNGVPFKPEPFKGRKGDSKRVAVVELFTGAQCPPCVGADVAFDAALRAYKPADVVFLQYHLHIPGPDALTNADSVARAEYYRKSVRGTPTAFVNGQPTQGLGGGREAGEDRYATLSKAINGALEEDTPIRLTLTSSRKGEKFEVEAEFAGVKATGEKTRLRFVVVEDLVHYVGSNNQRFHHHVVRGFIGKPEGFEVKKAKDSQAVVMNVADLKKTLGDYLNGYTDEDSMEKPFRGKENPLELKNLKVIALIQDDDTKEILQAAQVDVPDAK
jgi:hypothetical protein